MTARAHARHPLRERLTGLFRSRRRQPDLIPMRTVDYGDGPKIVGFWNEQPARPRSWGDDGYALGQDFGDAGTGQGAGPPWDLAAPDSYLNPGPGSLGAFWGAGHGHDLTVMDLPVTRTRPYAPEPESEPEPEPELGPEPVSYPPLSFTADFHDLPAFRTAARKCGLAPAGLVRAAGVMIP